MKMKEDERIIRKIFRRIKERITFPLPITIKFVDENSKKIEGCWGQCQRYKKRFVITIARTHFTGMVYTLLHEMAHAHYYNEDDFHCEQWGVSYSLVWKVYAEEC